MAIKLSDFDFGAIDSGLVLAEQLKNSAFQKLGNRVALPRVGTVVTGVTGVTSELVAEGGTKPVSGTGIEAKIGSNKFASIVVQTQEAWEYSSQIATTILETQPKAHATAFDQYIAGLVAIPGTFSNFVNLGATTNTQSIDAGVDASVDFDDAIALVASGEATGVALSTAMLSYLRRQRVGVTGVRVFDIEGDNNEGTIDGIPYAIFRSSTAVGFVGDFSRFSWGSDEEVFSRIAQDGIVIDDASVSHNLTQDNKIALINEIHQGANVLNLDDFVKISPVTGS